MAAVSGGIVDFHVHSGPSIVPRHSPDPETVASLNALGVERFVLKAHEGSTAERAQLAGRGVVGGVVLNSPVGGANPDAVDVAARLGARIVWLPTSSSVAHQAQAVGATGHEVHDHFSFATVPVVEEGRLLEPWHDVLDVVAHHDMILASGHIPMDEVIVVFGEARRRGLRRFIVNHPLLDFLRWTPGFAAELARMEARVEVGVLIDHLAGSVRAGTGRLLEDYPSDLFVFGSDLGFTGYPGYEKGYAWWMAEAEELLGSAALDRSLRIGGQELLAG